MSQLVDIATRHQAHLERLKSSEVKTFNAYLQAMLKNTRYELVKNGELTELNRRDLTKKINAIKRIIKAEFTDFKTELDNIIIEIAEYEAVFEAKSLNSFVKYDYAIPSSNQIKSAVFTSPFTIHGADGGTLVDSMYKNWTDKEIYKIGNLINLGYANGQTNDFIAKTLKKLGFGVTDRNMKTLIRTTVQHASSQARNATWKANSDIVEKIEWVSTLDTRTSSVCQYLDGKQWEQDDKNKQLPPAHPNCRSTTVAVIDKQFDVLDKGATRASRDPKTGKVKKTAATNTYYSWLKKQPAGVQDSIIGSSRGKLLRDGGLTVKRFTALQMHKNFTPMTLKEMQAIEPRAFEKAKIL